MQGRKLSRLGGAFALVAGLAGAALAATADAAAPAGEPAALRTGAQVSWAACPQYSDAVLGYLRIRPADDARFRAIWARTRCGTVSVPLDYRRPGGARITAAFTDLPATDPAERIGTMAMNPGGPGGSGYLMPATLTLESATDAELNTRYDLIGFDPRGVGYSTSFRCAREWNPSAGATELGRLSKDEVRARFDASAAQAAACSSSDPAFLTQLTTANAAADLEEIRIALHAPTMSFFGASWGTQLGAVYRSMFPRSVGRMWLDSVVAPDAHDLAYRFDGSAAAAERGFAQFADWLAQHADEYGLGDTPARVTAAITRLRAAADATPWQFSDIPVRLGGGFVSFLASAPNTQWTQAAPALAAMSSAVDGAAAPPAVKAVVGSAAPAPIPAGAPAQFNDTADQAYLCNEDTSSRDFGAYWAEYQRNLRANPVTGDVTALRPSCAGWRLPVRGFSLRPSSGSLIMSAHRYEASTPYPWAELMRRAIGGSVLTVDDFVHGSAVFVPECAAHIVAYFDSGSPDGTGCAGEQPGTGSAPLTWTGA
jgi:pimeloyl-ACP methyl ester carboxylesterase